MHRRWFLMFGALVLVLGMLAACGDDDDDDDTLDTESDVTATLELDTDETEEATEPAVAEGTATVGADVGTATQAEDGTATEDDDVSGTVPAGTSTEEDEATGTETDIGTATETDATETDETATETEVTGTSGTPTEADATATDMGGTATGSAGEDGRTATLGESFEADGLQITVEEAVDLSGLGGLDLGFLAPEEGNRFFGVSLVIENAGDEPIGLFEVLGRMHLEDEAGDEYDVDIGATALAVLTGEVENVSNLESGDEVTVVVGFQIPEDSQASDLTLVVESNDETAESVRVSLDES